MVLCFAALAVFSVLGIFSAKYRQLAKEAFDCVFRKMTLRPCTTGLDNRLKAAAVAKLAGSHVGLARFANRNFQALSFAFVVLTLGSAYFAGAGLYNLWQYGSCEPHSTQCVFNPGTLSCGSQHCATKGCLCGEGEEFCSPANNYWACEGKCDCRPGTCGKTGETNWFAFQKT